MRVFAYLFFSPAKKPDLLASVDTVGFFVVVVEKLWLNAFFKRCLMINAAR